jgi:hypothetical protein
VRPISDDYLLTAAQISATLIGLLFVGICYFLETGLGRIQYTRELVEPRRREDIPMAGTVRDRAGFRR